MNETIIDSLGVEVNGRLRWRIAVNTEVADNVVEMLLM